MCADRLNSYPLQATAAIQNNALTRLLLRPPSWTRLEPQSVSGNPDAWIEARVHDPLWLIGRQWQAGEFQGEDCGTPVAVSVRAKTTPISALYPGRPEQKSKMVALSSDATFEPWVEREPIASAGIRERAEAGAALLDVLVEFQLPVAPLLEDCRFAAVEADPSWQSIARGVPDGEAAAQRLEAGAPAWLAANVEAQAAANAWLAWYRQNVSAGPRAEGADSWQAERLEYAFDLAAGGQEALLRASMHDGGALDWYSFDHAPAASRPAQQASVASEHQVRVHANKLRYAGMPADRLWQFEDGLVNLGQLDVQPGDIVRLCFLEFATLGGNDWLVAPIGLPRGTVAQVTGVSYRTTFDEEIEVNPAADIAGKGRFSLFATSDGDGARTTFLIPPGGRAAYEGPAREEVVLARDQSANLAWAIELKVEGADGMARDRTREPTPDPALPPIAPGAERIYQLETQVPPWWIPLVPIPKAGLGGGFTLRKGSFTGEDASRGRILRGKPLDFYDEEIPREGVRIRRVPSLMRDDAGALVRWTARRTGPAGGESASHLAYDNTFRRD